VSTLYTSDQHFRHANIIKYCSRPFDSVAEMDNAMCMHLRDAEKTGARIVHLGDMSFDFARYVRENGPLWTDPKNHVYVFGNHDDVKGSKRAVYEQHFATLVGKPHTWASHSHTIVDLLDGMPVNVLLTHAPFASELPADTVNVHGHIHNNSIQRDPRKLNACVERHLYRPVTLDQLAARQAELLALVAEGVL
jgi:calcineurin-like phosphoesterase family protein